MAGCSMRIVDVEVCAVRRVLIVVDMQNDFVDEKGALNSSAARAIVPFVRQRVQKALQAVTRLYLLWTLTQKTMLSLPNSHLIVCAAVGVKS